MGRTLKVGTAGRFGVRYGKRIRENIAKAEAVKKHACPNCFKMVFKRESKGIWLCRKCGLKVAGKAYRP